MTISGSGLYGLTLVKAFTNATAIDLSAETLKTALVLDTYTPDYDAHDFYADISSTEASGTGYTAGGATTTGTTVTVASGSLKFDATDVSWSSSTIADAMAAVVYVDAVTDELVCLSDFVSAASSSNGTFTVQWDAAGIFTIDYVP